jgi:hypothetical protein
MRFGTRQKHIDHWSSDRDNCIVVFFVIVPIGWHVSCDVQGAMESGQHMGRASYRNGGRRKECGLGGLCGNHHVRLRSSNMETEVLHSR